MKNPKAKLILVIASAASVAAILVGVLVAPLWGLIQNNADSLRILQEKFEVMKEQQQRIQEYESFAAKYREEFNGLNALLVDAETPIDFIEFLEEGASLAGMEMTIVPGSVRKNPGDRYPAMFFDLTLEGSYPDAVLFLRRLEHAPYLLEIDKVETGRLSNTQRARIGEGPGAVRLRVSLRAFVEEGTEPKAL